MVSQNTPKTGVALVALLFVSAAPAPSAPVSLTKTSPHYRIELDIGTPERMYSPAETARLHPKSGEIMLSGTMTSMNMEGMVMGGMPMSRTVWRHLEVHVLSLQKEIPVRNINVAIVVTDLTTNRSQPVPIAVMYGLREGKADWHYGNNVLMPLARCRVAVSVNGEHVSFQFALNKP